MMECPNGHGLMTCTGIGSVNSTLSIKSYSCPMCLATVQGPPLCCLCGGEGEIMHMVERPGGPPGNWIGPCPKGCEIRAL